ncbi:DUF4156 domain-containing protein [Alteromonas flava]|uniref:DUF4156 domain-containing protein n=1 Tax=Alteromonas flava TaxID=2048003 RepID=UPI0013DCD0C1|nr:DUF4156 domain-containing protein [Alteromonas flava]
MKMKLWMSAAVIVLSGCAAKEMLPGAETIKVVTEAPEGNCEFVGEVIGSQGNWWTDDVTSTKNKMLGARNEMRNEAFKLGATHVHLVESVNTESDLSFDVTNSTVIGNAYKC